MKSAGLGISASNSTAFAPCTRKCSKTGGVSTLAQKSHFSGRSVPLLSPSVNRRRVALVIRSQSEPSPVAAPRAFAYPREKEGLQKFLCDLPSGVAQIGAIGALALSAVVGFIAGSQTPANVRTVGKAVGSAVGVGAAAFAVAKLGEERESGAAIDLYNTLVDKPDPSDLTKEEVEEIGKKYGVDMAKKLSTDLKMVYDQYLDSKIPRGDAPLTGKEGDQIRAFQEALGISDEDAASVHMDVGRRLSRSTFEMGNKALELESRKTFQKWIYISYRVFGERRAAFLLPLMRVFGLNQSQIMVARRDNAKAIFKSKIDQLGGELQADRQFLSSLRNHQLDVMLADDVAEEVVRAAARRRVESSLDVALKNVRERTRKKDFSEALKEMESVLEFNREMEALGAANDESLVPGLGKVTIHGSAFESATSSADQRELFKVYLEERLALDGQFTVKLGKDLDELCVVLALGPKEADSVREEVTSKMYRKMLKDEVASGRLDAAESKAAVLQKLCNQLQFKPELAAQMHRGIYTQKMEGVLAGKNKIDDEDNEELERFRKLLCIPEKDVKEVQKATCGGRVRKAIDDALGAGLDNFGEEDKNNVKRVMEDLRVPVDMAKEVLEAAARKVFLQYISGARMKPNKLESAKELKKMVFFSNIVVAPLLLAVKGDSAVAEAKAQAELQEILAEAQKKAAEEEAAEKAAKEAAESGDAETQASTSEESEEKSEETESPKEETSEGDKVLPSTLEKAKKGAESFEVGGDSVGEIKMSSQKEITVREDLDLRDRTDIYRNYLIYCMSGDVITMPMGGTVVLERDMSEFGRLSQLGDILGLAPMDVSKVHTDMAEQAYRTQVKGMIGDGMLTKEKAESLSEMREKLGLSKEQGEKIVKGVQNERMASSLQSAKAMGELTLQKILDMKESGVEVESFTSDEFRKSLYKKEAEKLMSDGKGDFDEDYMLESLPSDLAMEKEQALKIVSEVASGKGDLQMVQAMSDLRMKKFDSVVEDVNNLMVCSKVAEKTDAGISVKWDRRDEILDLYSVYYYKTKDEERLSYLQGLFEIPDTEAASLKKVVDDGQLRWAEEVEEDEVFF